MSTAVKFLPNFGRFLIPRVTVRTFYTKPEILLTPASTKCHLPPNAHKFLPAPQAQLHTSPPLLDSPSPAEESIISSLAASFPTATDIAVVDVSGGCGSMYEVYVEAPDFKGMRVVKQHQLVTKALSSQIKDMHGIRISTSASPCKPQ